jgi:hypothetical protein
MATPLDSGVDFLAFPLKSVDHLSADNSDGMA